MEIDLIAIGNSQGIRIPKTILLQCGFGKRVELQVEDNKIVLTPLNHPRAGWDQAFQQMALLNDEDPFMPDYLSDDFDENEWTWGE